MSETADTPEAFRILHMLSSERWTGAAEPVVSLARCQEELGHTTWFACMPGKSLERRARMMGLQMANGFRLNRRATIGHIWDALSVRRFVKQHNIDVIHAHLLNDHWLCAISMAGRTGPPLIVRTFHKLEAPRNDRIHQWLFCKHTHCAIAPSNQMRRMIEEKLTLPAERLNVIPGATNSQRFHPDVDRMLIRRELGIEPHAPVVGMVARMVPGRGHDWLLDSLPAVYHRLPDARTILVGRGPLKYTYRGRVSGAPHAGRTLWGGYRIEDLPEACAAFDVALFLGQGSEGSNRSVLEAMAGGKPVIAVNSGAASEYIDHGVNGLLIESGDVNALSEAIIELLADLSRAQEMGRKARAAVEERFSEVGRARKVVTAYQHAWSARFSQ